MVQGGNGEPTGGVALLCYDGSESAHVAIEQAAGVLKQRDAIVLTVWESVGSTLLRGAFPKAGDLGRDLREISEEVLDELDKGTSERALAMATEGAEVANAAGFAARPLARRALPGAGERANVTFWHEILAAADEEEADVIVLGSRGLSGMKSLVLGSVSYGVVHHSPRPVLVVPGPIR